MLNLIETQYLAARVAASVAEFCKVLAMGGEATLHLSTSSGPQQLHW